MKKKKDPDRSEDTKGVEQYLRIHPDYPDFQNLLGLLRVKEGKLKEAEAHFQGLFKGTRITPRPFSISDVSIWKKERRHEAESLLRFGSQRHPRNGFFIHLLAVLYLTLGKSPKAGSHIQRAIRLRPFYGGYYRKLGLWQRGRVTLHPSVMAVFQKVPSDHLEANFHNFIGLHLAREGRFSHGARELQKAARLEPNASVFHINLGFLNYLRGHYEEAVQEYRKGLRIDPSNGVGYAHLSYAYGATGRLQRALHYFEKAVQLNPTYADLHYNLALLYGGRRRYAEAIAELKKALRINPNYLFARINLGTLYEDLKEWNAARREYRKVLRITPEDDHVRKRLEKIS